MRAVPRSLFGQLVLAQIIYGGLLALGFMVVLGLTHARYHLEATQRLSLGWADKILRRHPQEFSSSELRSDDAPLRDLLLRLGQSSLSVDFHVIDDTGKILLSSLPAARLRRTSVDIGAVESLIRNPRDLPVTVEDPAEPGVSRIFSAARLGQGAGAKGYLIVLLRGQDAGAFLSHQGSRVLLESAVMMSGVSMLAFAAALALLVSILRPIRKLSGALEAFRRDSGIAWESEQGKKPELEGSDLERLSLHFNEMARRIVELLQRLNATDRKMRDMFANISHDLRTPLTVIQVCLETARSKGESLPAARCIALIDAALAQSRSLGRLIETVFELSKLQSPDYRPRLEPFSIAELVQDVTMKFSPKAAKCGVTIRIDGGDRHIQVIADVLLVERVFDNLIENALCHAVGASEITIRLMERAADLEVTVCDNGCSIPASAWNRILAEQAGKAPSYPEASEKRSGLGLRIVGRILELHDTRLELVTTAGNGTSFRFALRKTNCLGSQTEPN